MPARLTLFRLLVGMLAAAAVTAAPANAQEPDLVDPEIVYSVTTTGDAADAAVGDGVCRTANGTCSLRAALQEAAVDRATSVIGFALPFGSAGRIAPRTPLPAISDLAGPTHIKGDHVSKDGSRLRTELRGPDRSTFSGLTITSPGNTVGRLAIYNFRHQIRVTGWNNRIEDNYIGTDRLAQFAAAAGDTTQDTGGVLLEGDAANNTIAGNLISGNAGIGVLVRGTASANTITENDIGVLPSAEGTLPNRSHGVVLGPTTRFNVVGGGSGNIIGGNGGAGVRVAGTLNRVSDNAIGVTPPPGGSRWEEDQQYHSMPNRDGNVLVFGSSREARITNNVMAGSDTGVRVGEEWGAPDTDGITGTRVGGNMIGIADLIDPLPEIGVAVWQGSRVEIVENQIQYHRLGLLIRNGLPTPVTEIANRFEGNGTDVQIVG